jgi:hypothetical protein
MFGSYLPEEVGSLDPAKLEIGDFNAVGDTLDEDLIEHHANEVVRCGRSEKVSDDLEQLEEALCPESLICAASSCGSFESFAERVLPYSL